MNLIKKINATSFYFLSFSVLVSISFCSIYHILGFITGAIFLLKYPTSFNNSSKAIIALCGSIIISTIWANYNNDYSLKVIGKIKYFIIPILSIIPLTHFLKENYQNRSRKLYLIFIISSSIATLAGLYAYFFGYHPLRFKEVLHIERASGMFGMVMSYAHSVSFACTIFLGILVKNILGNDKKINSLTVIALITGITGLLFSFTRGAWIGFLISIPFLFLNKQNKIPFLKCGILTIIFGIFLFQTPLIKNTFETRLGSNLKRISLFKAAIEGFKESPILGLGHRNFEANSKRLKQKAGLPYPEHSGHAHNNYLEHLASLGSIGFIAFMLFVIFWGIEMWRNFTPLNQVFFAFYINFLVSGLTQYTFGDGENLFFIMGCYTITQVLANNERLKRKHIN